MAKNGKLDLAKVRNIGVIAHIDAGKTTTTERILYYTGNIHRIGEVHDGTATTDYMPQERERGITITAAAITAEWKGIQVNLIDTPGHVDFTAEVQRSLRVLDGGVVVFDGVAGVEPQSETVWRQADEYGVPRICFVNKMDRVGANYERCIDMMKKRLSAKPVLLHWPYGEGYDFKGIIDLLNYELVTYGDDLGTAIEHKPIPDELKEFTDAKRAQMIETIVENDEFLLEKYLMEEEVTNEELIAGLRAATVSGRVQPVLCGSALKNKGVQLLLDAVVAYLPSPLDIPPVKGTDPDNEEVEIARSATDDEPLAALVFKIITDPYVGRLAFVRVYSGVLKAGTMALNSTKGRKERIGRLVRMFADSREDIEEVHAGDIAALLGLKDTFTGDTLSDADKPVVLEKIKFPAPVIQVAIEPKTKGDQDKMGVALRKLAEEDPTFQVSVDDQIGQTIIAGMGELHLEVLVDRMMREFKVDATVGRPRVSYRETITRQVRIDTTFKRQTGGSGQFARVVVVFEPIPEDELEKVEGPLDFINEIRGASIPNEFIKPTRNGIADAMSGGVIAGYPVVGIRARLVDGSSHEVDSSEMAFKIAGSMCLKEGVQKGSPILLEPMMKIEVVSPDEYSGDIIGNLSARRAMIQGMEPRGEGASSIKASVPLAEMFGYATDLRNMTQGRGSFSMEFEKYNPVPNSVADEIIKGSR
jgi:elongation factor G